MTIMLLGIVAVLVARCWLARHEQGPMEWLRRMGTYWRAIRLAPA